MSYLRRLPWWLAALAVLIALVVTLANALIQVVTTMARAVGDSTTTLTDAAASVLLILAALPLTTAERGAAWVRARAPMNREE